MWETTSPFYFSFKTISPSFSWDKNNYPTHCSTRFDKKKKFSWEKKTKKQENFFSKWETKFLPKLVFELSVLRFFSYFPFFTGQWRKTFRVKYFLFSGDFFYFSNREFTAETNITFCFLLIFFPMTCFNWWKKNKGLIMIKLIICWSHKYKRETI